MKQRARYFYLIKKFLEKKLRKTLFYFTRIPLDWDDSSNWGDKLAPILVYKITLKKSYKPVSDKLRRYFVIGSILERAGENALVWGAGFISSNDVPSGRPRRIFAVRGPLTRDIFLRCGYKCPETYGDPAILLPYFFQREVRKNFKYGVIPHYADKGNSWVLEQLQRYGSNVLLIDIEGGVEEVIDGICSCEYIFSSSLHGLICADTYGIPNVRLSLSNKVIGGDFKFIDYRLGVGGQPHEPIDPVRLGACLESLLRFSSLANLNQARKKLMAACPF